MAEELRYFATEDTVTTADMSEESGWIEISAEQYQEGIDALYAGNGIVVTNGFQIRPGRPSLQHTWDGEEWVAPEPDVEDEPDVPEGYMRPLTARQLRMGLVLAGHSLEAVENAINSMPNQHDRAIANIEWEYATQFERSHPLIEQVGGALGLSSGQIDQMWEAALQL